MGSPTDWRDAVSGGCAGAVAKTCTAPLDRVKLVMQNQQLAVGRAAGSPLQGIQDAVIQLSREPAGVKSYWRGNLINVGRIVPTYGTRFGLYHRAERALNFVHNRDARRFLAGGLAGVGALLITHPLDTIRTRLAAARVFTEEQSYKGFFDCLRSTWRMEGFRGLYAACGISILEIAPYSAIAFSCYEGVKQRLEVPGQGFFVCLGSKVVAGLVSGILATCICYPVDTLRRQMMLDGAVGFDSRYQRSISRCCACLWREGRYKRFYAGWSVTLLKSVPTVTITFLINDRLREAFGSMK